MIAWRQRRLANWIMLDRVDDGLPLATLIYFPKPPPGLPVGRLPLKILLAVFHIVHLTARETGNRLVIPKSVSVCAQQHISSHAHPLQYNNILFCSPTHTYHNHFRGLEDDTLAASPQAPCRTFPKTDTGRRKKGYTHAHTFINTKRN